MSIDIEIHDAQGRTLARYDGPALGLPFLRLASPGSTCFRFIAPWADTTFNQEQIKVLLDELRDALDRTEHPPRQAELKSVIGFVEEAARVRAYVKFTGD